MIFYFVAIAAMTGSLTFTSCQKSELTTEPNNGIKSQKSTESNPTIQELYPELFENFPFTDEYSESLAQSLGTSISIIKNNDLFAEKRDIGFAIKEKIDTDWDLSHVLVSKEYRLLQDIEFKIAEQFEKYDDADEVVKTHAVILGQVTLQELKDLIFG